MLHEKVIGAAGIAGFQRASSESKKTKGLGRNDITRESLATYIIMHPLGELVSVGQLAAGRFEGFEGRLFFFVIGRLAREKKKEKIKKKCSPNW